MGGWGRRRPEELFPAPSVGPSLELDPQAEIGARVDPHFVVLLEVKVVK